MTFGLKNNNQNVVGHGVVKQHIKRTTLVKKTVGKYHYSTANTILRESIMKIEKCSNAVLILKNFIIKFRPNISLDKT